MIVPIALAEIIWDLCIGTKTISSDIMTENILCTPSRLGDDATITINGQAFVTSKRKTKARYFIWINKYT